MKKVIITASNYPKHIPMRDIVEFLEDLKCDESTLSDRQIKQMAKEIGYYLRQEEMLSGERYQSISDADIEGLCDAATTELHDMYYNLIFGPDLEE